MILLESFAKLNISIIISVDLSKLYTSSAKSSEGIKKIEESSMDSAIKVYLMIERNRLLHGH